MPDLLKKYAYQVQKAVVKKYCCFLDYLTIFSLKVTKITLEIWLQ